MALAPLIEFAGVSKVYPGAAEPAVDRLDLAIAEGEFLSLLGPSGSGKTTCLMMLAGFEPVSSGTIRLRSQPIEALPAHRRNLGVVFQSYSLFPHMTVAGNVAFPLQMRKVPAAEIDLKVRQALMRVRLEAFASRRPNQLSGGQQQRVALARALVIEPDVVLLDEPLSNLDARLRLEMRHEIRRIHDETGITMVYVTHDQKESLSMADMIAVMSMGRVEQLGDPRTIYRRPANRFVADFIGETNLIDGTLARKEEPWGWVESELGLLRARLGANAPAAGGQATLMIRPEGLQVGRAGGENQFRGKVTGNIYLGQEEQFRLKCGEREFQAAMANPGEKSPRTGEEVQISFAAEDAVVLAWEPREKEP